MDYESYIYRTPEEDRELMAQPRCLPEFAEEAAEIITTYVRKYKPPILPCGFHEGLIRDLLSYERMTKKKLKPEARDYWIKVYLILQHRDFEYEETLLEPSQRSVQ